MLSVPQGMEALKPPGMNIENLQSGHEMRNVEFNLAKHVKDKKKGFFKHINKWKTKDDVGRLLKGGGTLITEDTEKAELLNAFFSSDFTDKTRHQESLIGETLGKEGREGRREGEGKEGNCGKRGRAGGRKELTFQLSLGQGELG